jgi:hypothetical protein
MALFFSDNYLATCAQKRFEVIWAFNNIKMNGA